MKLGISEKERIIYVTIISFIFIAIAIIISPHKEDYKNRFDSFWISKTFSKPNYDCIIIGDSRVYRGLSPNAIEDIIPDFRVLNFAYSSGRINSFIMNQAEQKLRANSKNKIIIIGITPNALTAHTNENEQLIELIKTPREERYEALYFHNFLKYFAPIKIQDFKKNKSESNKIQYIEDFHDNGWVASNKIPEDTTEAFSSYKKWFQEAEISNKNINSIYNFTKKWTNDNTMVFAFRIPTSQTMKTMEDSILNFDEKEFIDNFKKSGGIWLNINNNKYHSYDGSHLNKKSAIRLSKEVAIKIKNHL